MDRILMLMSVQGAMGAFGRRAKEPMPCLVAALPGRQSILVTGGAGFIGTRLVEALGVRVVRLRFGPVLGAGGGVLACMLLPFEFGLGGPMGRWRQWMSRIRLDDIVGLILHAISVETVTGPMNATAPEPVRERRFRSRLEPRAPSSRAIAGAGAASSLRPRPHRGSPRRRPARAAAAGGSDRLAAPLPDAPGGAAGDRGVASHAPARISGSAAGCAPFASTFPEAGHSSATSPSA